MDIIKCQILQTLWFAIVLTINVNNAQAQGPFDGVWNVNPDGDNSGKCIVPPGWRHWLHIQGGRIRSHPQTPGSSLKNVQGFVDKNGNVTVTGQRYADKGYAGGTLASNPGWGNWYSPDRGCGGTWKAERIQ